MNNHNQPERPEKITKEVVKEALKEWLDEKFLSFGKWTAVSILAALLCAAVYFIFWVELKK